MNSEKRIEELEMMVEELKRELEALSISRDYYKGLVDIFQDVISSEMTNVGDEESR